MKEESLLHRINPISKLILMAIATITVTFAYDIYTPLAFFISILILASIFGHMKLSLLLRRMIKFVLIGISFSIFIIGSRLVVGDGLNESIIMTAVSLCLRIMVFSLTSIVFVFTTDPNEFGLSLIHQLKVSHKFVYPFLVAYRFIPTFKDEMEKIILAKEARGISSSSGIFSGIINLPKYILPLLSSAIRKGERISNSMETRGFGAYEDRTYYRRTSVNRDDYLALAFFAILSLAIILVGIYMGTFRFRLGLVIN